MKGTIGILGGMGPEATVYMFDLIVRLTDAEKDQDHIPVIIYNNPHIPDRTKAIREDGPSPLKMLTHGAKLLEKSGASFIIMPCVTAHYLYYEIKKNIKIPFLHLIEETFEYIKENSSNFKRIGLLATDGTLSTDLFHKYCRIYNIDIVLPDKKNQKEFMDTIYGKQGIKAGYKIIQKRTMIRIVEDLIEKKAQAIIMGCTEIPLILKDNDVTIPLIDPLEIIAKKSIIKANAENI